VFGCTPSRWTTSTTAIGPSVARNACTICSRREPRRDAALAGSLTVHRRRPGMVIRVRDPS